MTPKEYIETLPIPKGFELYDGFDTKNTSATFFRSLDGKQELKVIVELTERKLDADDAGHHQ